MLLHILFQNTCVYNKFVTPFKAPSQLSIVGAIPQINLIAHANDIAHPVFVKSQFLSPQAYSRRILVAAK